MTRRVSADGTDLVDALGAAVAQLVDCEREKVDLRLDAPGTSDLEGTIEIDLRITAATEDPRALGDDELDAQPVPSSSEVTADAGDDTVDEVDDAASLDEEADAAADFVEGLLDAMELPGDLRLRIAADHAEVEIIDASGGVLIGRRGQTLEAVQELLRCSLQRQFERRCRVMIDIEGYRARRLEKIVEKAHEAIDDVLDSGDSQRLEPMDVFERKTVHQLVGEVEGVASHSQGHEPARRVVIEAE